MQEWRFVADEVVLDEAVELAAVWYAAVCLCYTNFLSSRLLSVDPFRPRPTESSRSNQTEITKPLRFPQKCPVHTLSSQSQGQKC